MQTKAVVQGRGVMQAGWSTPGGIPLLARFLGKFVLDILPAALASVIGGFLFTQYQFGHATTPRPVAEQVTPASAEMLALVRDEHAAIIDYLKTQMATEKNRAAAENEDAARATADAKAADAKAADAKAASDAKAAAEVATRRLAANLIAAKSAPPRKPAVAVASAPREPLVIAQAQTLDAAPPSDRLARDPDSLLAKTLDLKDHVVAATRSVVSAIGDAFSSVGERFGRGSPTPPATGRQFSSAS